MQNCSNNIIFNRIFLPTRTHIGNAGIKPLQAIDEAAWVWHPQPQLDVPAFILFRAEFTVDESNSELTFHTSTDQRYELYFDGMRISKGPERSDVNHWSFKSFSASLTPGKHVLEAHV